jgi:hypothetical protein
MPSTGRGHTMMRIWVSTHAMLKALSGMENKNMMTYLDDLLRREAERKGLVLNEPDANYNMTVAGVQKN